LSNNTKRHNWTRADTILALELYYLLPPATLNNKADPKIQALAAAIGSTAGSVKARLQNFKSLDPFYTATGRAGLPGYSAQDAEIAKEFMGQWSRLIATAADLKEKIGLTDNYQPLPSRPKERIETAEAIGADVYRSQKMRQGQSFFRAAVLAAYNNRCCITGMKLPALLRASHIKPWSAADSNEKLNPSNGLLLNALLDAAFDKGYFTVLPNYKITLAQEILDSKDEAIHAAFLPYAKQEIHLPSRFPPDRIFLEYHNDCIFQN